jgi:hypothetical protein
MLFQSQVYVLIFLPIAVGCYYAAAGSERLRQWVLIGASLFFYGWWDPRFIPLLIGQISATWLLTLLHVRLRSNMPLVAGIALNLASLATFKYLDFLLASMESVTQVALPRAHIILPIGISFFSFQLISYLVDRIRAEAPIYPFQPFALFVLVYPHLIAGPIVRHNELIPQFSLDPRRDGICERAGAGLVIFTVGFAKKVLLADKFAGIVDPVFADAARRGLSFGEAWSATVGFSFQLYLDFSAYTEMAIGSCLQAWRWRRWLADRPKQQASTPVVDPYNIVPFSLPLERRIMSTNHRFMAAQIVRGKRFDSLIVGTSTSFMLDPVYLNDSFNAKFVNLSMASMTTWEQARVVEFFLHKVKKMKVLIVGVDSTWCDQRPPRFRSHLSVFPEWLYDDNPWNDYLHLLNVDVLALTVRIIGNQFGLFQQRIRDDGFAEFMVQRLNRYGAATARADTWRGTAASLAHDVSPPELSTNEKKVLQFPAIQTLDDMPAKLSPATLKIIAYMPVHVMAQPRPGTREAALEAECKARIATAATKNATKVVDWRISSAITRDDTNYSDAIHYWPSIGQRIARELAPAMLESRESEDGTYHLVVK